MAKKTKKPTVAEANRTYFKVLANTRATLGSLAGLAIVVIAVLGVANVGPLNGPSRFSGYEVLSYLAQTNVVLMFISAAVVVLSVFKKVIYRFQVFFSAVMAALAGASVYSICLLALPVATLTQARGEQVYATLFNIIGLLTLLLLAGATLVHMLLLRRRLQVGHSEKRTLGNYLAVSGSNRAKIFWIVFGVAAIVPNVLTLGQYLINSLGIVLLIFFACVTPSLPVEFAYLAYLKSKDRDYWERPPRPVAKEVRLRLARKIILWVVGIAGALALFWLLAKYVL